MGTPEYKADTNQEGRFRVYALCGDVFTALSGCFLEGARKS